jgi:YggT family protein
MRRRVKPKRHAPQPSSGVLRHRAGGPKMNRSRATREREAAVNLGHCACDGCLQVCRAPARVAAAFNERFGFMVENPFVWLIRTVITLYIWLLIAQAILSWLLAFSVVNRYNRAVAVIGDFLYRVTEPALRPIRRFLPSFGGIDISPVVLILLLMFLQRFILYLYYSV